ncbi:hypothetical protein MUN84_18305 [Hymenobacter sp. 5516J-16]|uniref:hypothetical protein n=1 Tax=Hymenobacter sp. 5516J-16 TaxID=2932253 RepID=UPI001FD5D451|nr:hypothetical protein [Hymenobacter sp. 5516J-16]UOQ76473.1 hypothetical protein MUN84_18305 [Hymenobacter sp. 5516J-16]
MRNARERLALLFGPAAHLHLANDPHSPDMVVAHLQLPVAAAVPAEAPAVPAIW